MRFGPSEVEEGVLCVEPGHLVSFQADEEELSDWRIEAQCEYHFSATMPLGVNPRT